jgi:capsular polysaccharide biosynthesis protein
MDRAKLISVVQVSKAMTPDKPAKPKNLLFVAGGVFMGILAAGGMLVFTVVTSNIFVTEQSVERLLGLPVLVTVPLLRRTNPSKALGHA